MEDLQIVRRKLLAPISVVIPRICISEDIVGIYISDRQISDLTVTTTILPILFFLYILLCQRCYYRIRVLHLLGLFQTPSHQCLLGDSRSHQHGQTMNMEDEERQANPSQVMCTLQMRGAREDRLINTTAAHHIMPRGHRSYDIEGGTGFIAVQKYSDCCSNRMC